MTEGSTGAVSTEEGSQTQPRESGCFLETWRAEQNPGG